jgi:hypothetical protein
MTGKSARIGFPKRSCVNKLAMARWGYGITDALRSQEFQFQFPHPEKSPKLPRMRRRVFGNDPPGDAFPTL